MLLGAVLLGAALLSQKAAAADVTFTLVTPSEGKMVSIESAQNLWKSPFGGWSLTLWPFAIRVGDTPLFEYLSVEQKLDSKTLSGAIAPQDQVLDALMNKTLGQDSGVSSGDLATTNMLRRASATAFLTTGTHVIEPFGIEWTLAADGTVTSSDPRVRVDAKTRRVEMVCHPVTIKMLDGGRSGKGPLQVMCGTVSLLGGIEKMFADYDKLNAAKVGTAINDGYRRFTIYLPPSSAGHGYTVNGVKFELNAEGKITLAADAKASCKDGRQIYLERPAVVAPTAVAAAAPMLGVSWFGGRGDVRVSCGSATVVGKPVYEGAAFGAQQANGATNGVKDSGTVAIPTGNASEVRLGDLAVRLPAVDAQRPHRHLIWNVADATCWAVEAPPLEAKPGAEWSCRIAVLTGKPPALPAALRVTLETMAGTPAAGGNMEWKGAAGVFTGTLPATPGFWRLRVAATDSSPLRGQTLGYALIGDKAVSAVSLFTVNNRALQRRGDAIDLLWFARRNAGAAAAEWPVRLRGMGLDAIVARIAVPVGSGSSADASGRLVVDTSALAAGEYTAVVEADGVAGYPFRFRICQRERLSDFDIYSFSPHTTAAEFYPGSPINSYVGPSPGGPGLEPFMAVGDVAYDGAMAAYANAPFGPAREMFARPGADELARMAMASQGVHVAPTFPGSHADESRNPKHTLPENLANVRRRMTLYVQSQADYPGVGGFDFGWLSSYGGYWEYTPRLDAWQPQAAAAANAWAWKRTKEEWPKVVAKYAHLKPINKTLSDKWNKELADIPGLTEAQMGCVNQTSPFLGWWDRILPSSFDEWFADVNEIRPGMTMHDHKSSPSLNGPFSWLGKSHRSSVDFSEYFLSPMDCFRSPAVMAMDNRNKQKIQIAVQTHGSSLVETVPLVLGAAGRGADGIAFSGLNAADAAGGDALPRILERFGSWFTTLDPLPDVAVYDSPSWGARVFTVLYDLARLRRPGMMVGPQDVEAGDLLKYKVLLLVGQEMNMPPEILDAFRAFEAKGGVILKDDTCAKDVPGRSIGFAYDKSRVSTGWGGAQAGGEGEFVWALSLYLAKEKLLVDAFAKTPQPVVTTPDTDILISPLAGKDSIICFTIDKTEVPLEVTCTMSKSDRFRQQCVMPKVGELQVEKGWYVHDLLAGKAAPVESTAKGVRVPVDFRRSIGAIYLVTRREPKSMSIQAERTTPINARLTGGLADAEGKLLADPMPFEVTLKGPDGATLFHKFASIGPEQPFDVPVPAMSAGVRPELVVRDLVLGTTVTQALDPAAPAAVAIRQSPDLIGGEKKILAFFSQRKGPVTILLDEGQELFRPAAEKMAALLKKAGREVRVTTFDPAEIRPLPLRWYPLKEDLAVIQSVTNDFGWAWRINKNPWAAFEKDKNGKTIKSDYSLPDAGYAESGPKLRHDADVVLFGTPANHRAVADLAPYLRRVPTENYPATGNFFVHYVWSPFRAGYDALYMGCGDVAGAEAAVACLATLTAPAPAPVVKPEGTPIVLRSGAPTTLEDVSGAMDSTPIINAEFSPSGNRLFAITTSYGDWLFVLDPDGKLLEQRMPPNTKNFPYWFVWGRWMTPLSDTLLRLNQWNGVYQYDLSRGWISKAEKVPMLEDPKTRKVFRSNGDQLLALDAQGSVLWRYEDSTQSADLTTVRTVIPRAFSGNRRVILVSAFMSGPKNTIVAPSVLGLDYATGKVLWQRNGLTLNKGKAIPLDDRFLVLADDASAHELIAESGRSGNAMAALTGSPDWVLQLPGRDALLIVENNHFSQRGPSCRAYLRPIKGGQDQDLSVPGRVITAVVAPDNQSFVLTTSTKRLLRFAADGSLIWDIDGGSGSIVRFSPDGKTLVTAGADGVLRVFNALDGKLRRATDLSVGNAITAEKFAKQELMGDVPPEAGSVLPPLPLEPSYQKSIPRTSVSFDKNLAPPEQMRTLLKPANPVTVVGEQPGYLGTLTEAVTLPPFKADAGTTYLVELINGVGISTNTDSMLRLEISVTGKQKTQNLPCMVRLPVDSTLVRRRFAFRADQSGDVTVTMRPIMPAVITERNTTRRTFDKVETSTIPVVIGDVFVSAIRFRGRNVLFDGGPSAGSKPYGAFDCMLYALSDGNSATEEVNVKSPSVGFQLVNGAIANNKTIWAKISGRPEGELAYADAVAQFSKPSVISAIAVYEDGTGPVINGASVRERTAMRYAVEVSNKSGQWSRIGVVTGNRQLVNIFPGPTNTITGIRYVWAGRHDDVDLNRTDGFVRTGQIEAYVEDMGLDFDDIMKTDKGDILNLD
jgi:WD40 repeat protein